MKRRFAFYMSVIIPVVAILYFFAPSAPTIFGRLVRQRYTVSDRLNEFGPRARGNLMPFFQRAGVSYPPNKIALVVVKDERKLEVYASDSSGPMKFIRDYKVFAASGALGPKLHEGDLQVPEGLYRIESLNPNSQFYVSLRVNYPNEIDRKYAVMDARTRLGGDIMIHGSMVSVGCVAIGDDAIEEIFSLAADVGLSNIDLIITPLDFRNAYASKKVPSNPPWIKEVYGMIEKRLNELPRRGIEK